MDVRAHIGQAGEGLAAGFLRRRGFNVVDRNVENAHGEIDLIAVIDGVRVAVEVRSRVGEDPLAAFDWSKIDRVRRTAHGLDPPCHRIDLITIEFGKRTAGLRWLPDV